MLAAIGTESDVDDENLVRFYQVTHTLCYGLDISNRNRARVISNSVTLGGSRNNT